MFILGLRHCWVFKDFFKAQEKKFLLSAGGKKKKPRIGEKTQLSRVFSCVWFFFKKGDWGFKWGLFRFFPFYFDYFYLGGLGCFFFKGLLFGGKTSLLGGFTPRGKGGPNSFPQRNNCLGELKRRNFYLFFFAIVFGASF